MQSSYQPINIDEIIPKNPLSPKKMTAHLFDLHATDMLKAIQRLFKESEEAKFPELNKMVATLLPYFFIKSENAMELNLEEQLSKIINNPNEYSTETIEEIVKQHKILLELLKKGRDNNVIS